jgi:hypothetical protein
MCLSFQGVLARNGKLRCRVGKPQAHFVSWLNDASLLSP